jgi:hypothetical protein
MIGSLIDGILDAAWTAAAGFFKTADQERDEWLSSPNVATYAPPIVRHYEEWPGGPVLPKQENPGPPPVALYQARPYQAWPGGRS